MIPQEVWPALASATALVVEVPACSVGNGKWVNFLLALAC